MGKKEKVWLACRFLVNSTGLIALHLVGTEKSAENWSEIIK